MRAACHWCCERLKYQSPTPVARCTHLASGPPFFPQTLQITVITVFDNLKTLKKDGAVSSCVSVVLMTFKRCCQHEKWKVKVPVSNTSGTLHASRLRPTFFSPNFTDYCYYCFWQFENFEKKTGLCQVVCQWCWWLLNAAANTKSERLKCQSPTPVARCTHLASGPPFSPNFTDYCYYCFCNLKTLKKRWGCVKLCVSGVDAISISKCPAISM